MFGNGLTAWRVFETGSLKRCWIIERKKAGIVPGLKGPISHSTQLAEVCNVKLMGRKVASVLEIVANTRL